ncbi:NmrA family NAD(P)-binding protein [Rhodococcus sp. MEB064]|uniref:NmrA family NAD(P)-binding protein n=1 Tax=Rhodococcus sp. MEB064 TaxID=1587522 RepID=UPI0005ACB17A|nr:NmrA family NAD(P)-binding protein [Rhodococcus sp. MEB064]KIQ17443.1 hypothetical protein RU01_09600 [Rhodococcus sp. MEB064]
MANTTVLVTGSTGKTGRRVSERLRQRGHDVREASRSSRPSFDWQDHKTWPPALHGVDAVYVVIPDLGDPAAVETTRSFAAHAAAAGVRKAVMVSVPIAGTDDSAAITDTEKAFTAAGLALTALRLRWFNQNFSEDFLLDSVTVGDIRVPAGDGREAFVDADDIADVAVQCLLDDVHDGRYYELTGPDALSFKEVAAILTEITGRTITYSPLSAAQFISEQEASGAPTDWAHALTGLYSKIADGSLDSTSTDIEAVLGRPARSFRSYATATAQAWTS